MTTRLSQTCTLLSLALLLASCGIFDSDDAKERVGGDPPFTVATEPDELIELLQRAYNERNYELYASLMHEDFEFEFPADEHDLAGTADGRWDRIRDAISTEKMLSGEPNKEGRVLQNIEMTLTEVDESWSAAVEEEFLGTQVKTYAVQMLVRVSGDLTYQVLGEQTFFVIEVEDRWLLRFWRDKGVLFKRATASTSVGALKSLY